MDSYSVFKIGSFWHILGCLCHAHRKSVEFSDYCCRPFLKEQNNKNTQKTKAEKSLQLHFNDMVKALSYLHTCKLYTSSLSSYFFPLSSVSSHSSHPSLRVNIQRSNGLGRKEQEWCGKRSALRLVIVSVVLSNYGT